MTAEEFKQWLEDMQAAGLARSDAECGRMLGITPRQIVNIKHNGSTDTMALACAALLKRIKPYQG